MSLSRTEAQRLAATDTSQADQAQGLNLAAYLASEASGHVYTPETLALIKQAEADIAAEQGDDVTYDNPRLSPNMYWPAPEQGDLQWAGPSLPHPTEATSEEEADELREDWGDYDRGIEPNQEQLEA